MTALTSCHPAPTQPTRLTVAGKTYLTLTASTAQYQIALASKRPDGTRYRKLSAFRAEHANVTFATNGGIFGKDYAPLGLYIENGQTLVPLNTADGEGNFYTSNPATVSSPSPLPARVAITETSAFSATPETAFALQSGPLLLQNNIEHPAFDANSANRRTRSAVGLKDDHTLVFVLSETPVTFHELALLFRDHLACPTALYLDGDLSDFSPPSPGTKSDIATLIHLTPK